MDRMGWEKLGWSSFCIWYAKTFSFEELLYDGRWRVIGAL